MAPAVVPAISECSGFSFLLVMVKDDTANLGNYQGWKFTCFR